jgi:hypothetical protein
MYATRALRLPKAIEDEDQRVILRGMTWKDFEVLLALRACRAIASRQSPDRAPS